MSDETVGEVVDKVKALGTYSHVGPDGTVWHLRYIGEWTLSDWQLPEWFEEAK